MWQFSPRNSPKNLFSAFLPKPPLPGRFRFFRRMSGGYARRAGAALRQIGAELVAHLGVPEGEFDGRLQIAELAAAVVPHAFVAIGQHLFLVEHRLDGVGELDLAAGARLQLADISLSNHTITSTPIVIPNTRVKIGTSTHIIP